MARSKNEPSRRRDAEENRTRIVSAAREVFAASGFDAPLDAIARRAGVGRATLYRNFPDRYALGAAIFEHNLAALEDLAREHRDRPDAFLTILHAMVEHQTAAHALVPGLLLSPRAPDLRALLRRVTRLLNAPLRNARNAGFVRADLTLGDVIDTLAMISTIVTGRSSARLRQRRASRALELLLHGIAGRNFASR